MAGPYPIVSRWVMPGLIRDASTINPEYIIEGVCRYFGLSVNYVISCGRKRDAVLARQIIYYLSRKNTAATLKSVGTIVGGKDHTTVVHGIKTITNIMSVDASLRKLVFDIESKIVNPHLWIRIKSATGQQVVRPYAE